MATGSLIAAARLSKDVQFWAAVIAAPIFWAALWFYTAPHPDWDWPLAAPGLFLLLVVVYPVLEELVFRGALQSGLRSRNWGMAAYRQVTVANVITSVVFVLTHLIVNPSYLSIAVFLPSLIFGYFRDRYAQLHASILLHILYNAGYIWLFTSIPSGV